MDSRQYWFRSFCWTEWLARLFLENCTIDDIFMNDLNNENAKFTLWSNDCRWGVNFSLALSSAVFGFLLRCTVFWDLFLCYAICRKIPRDLIDGGITIWCWIIHFCNTSNVVFVWNGQFSISNLLSTILYFLSGYIILLGFSLYVAQK